MPSKSSSTHSQNGNSIDYPKPHNPHEGAAVYFRTHALGNLPWKQFHNTLADSNIGTR
ncbi:MAG: hypothetical protein ACI87E_001314, partial [Mariniblastus sp.]